MSERVLVTGATGFIGHHLVTALLEAGDQVSCLVRPTSDTSGLPASKLDFRMGDIRDPDSLKAAVEGTRAVYHLAASIAGHDPAQLKEVNEAGVRNLAEAAAALESPPALILVSSIEAAGPDPNSRPRTEGDPSTPVSNYGKSKLAGERAIAEYAQSLPITIVRASGVFGEGDRETYTIAKAFEVPGINAYAIPRAHSARVSLIHARDLADMLILSAGNGERINTASGNQGQGLYYAADREVLTLGELFGRVATARTEVAATVVSVPMGFAWIGAGALEAWARIRRQSPGVVTIDKVRSFASGSFTCSPEKAQQQLGFTPARPLSERINQTIEWYQAEGWL